MQDQQLSNLQDDNSIGATYIDQITQENNISVEKLHAIETMSLGLFDSSSSF